MYVYLIGAIVLLLIWGIPKLITFLKYSVTIQSISFWDTLIKNGKPENEVLLFTLNRLRFREPFIKLTDDDIQRMFVTFENLVNSKTVAIAILQACEWSEQNIEALKKQETLTQWAITEEAKETLKQLFSSAEFFFRTVKKSDRNYTRLDSMAEAVLNRPNWKFDGDAVKYRDKVISLPNPFIRNYLKMVLIEEISYYNNKKNISLVDCIVRTSILDNIDEFMDKGIDEIASK